MSDLLFQSAFEYAAIGMALVAPDGRWLRVNRSLCQLVGYTPAELAEMTFVDITHPDDIDADLAHVRELLEGERETYQMEKRYFHKEGHIVWVQLSVSLVRCSAGTPLHFISQIQDITQRKVAEQNLDFLFTLPNYLPCIFGFDGYVRRTGPGWERLTGFTREHLLSTPYRDLLHPEDVPRADAEIRKLATGGRTDLFRSRTLCADGSYRWLLWGAVGAPERGLFYAMAVDITPLHEAEQQLRESLSEKERLLGELAKSAAQIRRLQSDFFTVCAWTHRIRCNGEWVSFEEFLASQLDMQLSHGISEEAAQAFLQEAS